MVYLVASQLRLEASADSLVQNDRDLRPWCHGVEYVGVGSRIVCLVLPVLEVPVRPVSAPRRRRIRGHALKPTVTI